MIDKRITRRDAIKQGSSALVGAAALGLISIPAKADQHAMDAVETPEIVRATNDITVALRNWFANRCPLVTRLPWVPTDESETRSYSHRYATAEELTSASLDSREGMFTIGRSDVCAVQDFHFTVDDASDDLPKVSGTTSGGLRSPYNFHMTMQLQNMVDSVESCIYRGHPSPEHPKTMTGLTNAIKSSRVATQDKDVVRVLKHAVDHAKKQGGLADLILVSSAMVHKDSPTEIKYSKRVVAGETVFGTPIYVFESDEIPGSTIIECPFFRPTDMFVLTSSEICLRNKVNPHFAPKGSGGQWVCAFSLELTNEHHHVHISMV